MLMLKSTYECEKCGKEFKSFEPSEQNLTICIDFYIRSLCKSCSKKFKREFERWLSDTKK